MANSFPNGNQITMTQQDSDPDYNLTLTAENFSGMRQAIAQSMEIDHEQSMADFYAQQPQQQQNGKLKKMLNQNETQFLGIPQQNGHSTAHSSQQQKPRFYIDSYQPQQQGLPQVHTTIGARHVFIVESNRDPSYSLSGQMPQTSVGTFQVCIV